MQGIAAELGIEPENVTPGLRGPGRVDPQGGRPAGQRHPAELQAQGPRGAPPHRPRLRPRPDHALGLHPAGAALAVEGHRPPLALGEVDAPPRLPLPRPRRQPGRLPPAARQAPPRPALGLPLHQHRRPDRAARPAPRLPQPRRRGRRPSRRSRSTAPAPSRWRISPPTTPLQQERVEQELGDAGGAVRTALSVEPRDGRLCVFMPPVESVEDYLDLDRRRRGRRRRRWACRSTSRATRPPPDPRLNVIRVAPDPGVIEVNIHPAALLGRLRRHHHRASTRRPASAASAPTSS